MDNRYRAAIIAGIPLDGSVLGTIKQYNKQVQGDGMKYRVKPRGGSLMELSARLVKAFKKGLSRWHGKEWECIRIPISKEASHQFRMGDTGAGKTSLTYQDLLDAEANDIACVINDAKDGEALARFYNPKRGDVILNPTDARCAYWNINSEGYDLATYKTVMTSLFPPPTVRDPTSDIFNQWTVSLGAYLLDQFQPDTETLGAWIANYPEIERRVQGTIHQYTLPANSPNQRAGVLGTLALAGDPLWMMPGRSEGRQEFCIREWTRDPKGWVYFV